MTGWGNLPLERFLEKAQAFLRELHARPTFFAEAAALMGDQGGLEPLAPLLDWAPGPEQSVFALEDTSAPQKQQPRKSKGSRFACRAPEIYEDDM